MGLAKARALFEPMDESAAASRLGAALHAIGEAAAIVDARGQIIEANAAARELVRTGVRLPYEPARSTLDSNNAWTVTPIGVGPHDVREYLIVLRAGGEDALHKQVRTAADRWSLTRRKREVLSMVVEGRSNQTIASELEISLRTVEVHVTGLLDKAGAASRAALCARVFTLR